VPLAFRQSQPTTPSCTGLFSCVHGISCLPVALLQSEPSVTANNVRSANIRVHFIVSMKEVKPAKSVT
jgi:hypothetical protein